MPPEDQPVLEERDLLHEAGEEDVPCAVLFAVAGLLLLAFLVYLTIGGHEHFH